MKLNEKEIDALAKIRLKSRKEIFWNRKYTIPTYIATVVVLVAVLVNFSLPSVEWVDANGEKLTISDSQNKIVVDGVEYTKAAGMTRNFPNILDYIIGLFLVSGGIIYYLWAKKLKRPYISAFKEYYKQNGELMD